MDSRHGMWTAIGIGAMGLGALGLIGMYTWSWLAGTGQHAQDLIDDPAFRTALFLLWIAIFAGLYALIAPFAGFPLPKTRTEPFWRRMTSPSANQTSDAINRSQHHKVKVIQDALRTVEVAADLVEPAESFDKIRLDDNQTDLLRTLVKANNAAKRAQPFTAHATLTIGPGQPPFGPPSYYSVTHPGLPKRGLSAARLDLEALAYHKLIVLHQTTAFGSQPVITAVDLTPGGVDYVRERLQS